TRSLAPGEVLTASSVATPRAVRRGAVVTLLVEGRGFRIVARGGASEDGAVGDTIKVVNQSSRREMAGRVEDGRAVRIPFYRLPGHPAAPGPDRAGGRAVAVDGARRQPRQRHPRRPRRRPPHHPGRRGVDRRQDGRDEAQARLVVQQQVDPAQLQLPELAEQLSEQPVGVGQRDLELRRHRYHDAGRSRHLPDHGQGDAGARQRQSPHRGPPRHRRARRDPDHRAERARPAPGRGRRQHGALGLRGRRGGSHRGSRPHLGSPAAGALPTVLRVLRVVLMAVVAMRRLAVAALVLLTPGTVAPLAAQPGLLSARVKDVGRIVGVRDNELYGYGIVIGLNGTGDRRQSSFFTVQSLTNLLQRQGINLPPTNRSSLETKNIGAVMVTAKLPAFARAGHTIAVTVSSIGDATSLLGGTLLMTPLTSPGTQVSAAASGADSIGGGFSVTAGSTGETAQKNHPTVGRIVSGATVEREFLAPVNTQRLTIALLFPDFTTAARLAQSLNAAF